MHRIGVGILFALLVLILGSVPVLAGQQTQDSEPKGVHETEDVMCLPMGTIVLGPPESVESKRASVDFPHSKHFVYDCKTCHHKWKGDAKIQDCTTSGCHDVQESPLKSKKGKIDRELAVRYYKTAFHKQCIDCHKQMKAKNKELEMSQRMLEAKLPETGPTTCVKCHPRQE